jgi:hypothetical protein
MNNIFYKDIKLSIHPIFFIMPVLTGGLFLIPKWPYFIALMYFFWISIPNIFAIFNAQNDFGFSITMPVSKPYIVKGKFMSFLFLELLHLATGTVFALIRKGLYGMDNFALNPNMAFFGIACIGFGLFNILFFPHYFRTAYKYGAPLIIGIVVITLFFTGVEFSLLAGENISRFMEDTASSMRLFQLGVLIFGMIVFALLSFITVRMSVKRFEKVDL